MELSLILEMDDSMWIRTKSDAEYRRIHYYVAKNLLKPSLCVICNTRPPNEIANISPMYDPKTYNKELSNWRWVCHSCHTLSDRRKIRATEDRWKNSSCTGCGIKYTDTKRWGRRKVRFIMENKGTDLFLCRRCIKKVFKR